MLLSNSGCYFYTFKDDQGIPIKFICVSISNEHSENGVGIQIILILSKYISQVILVAEGIYSSQCTQGGVHLGCILNI